MKTDAVQQCTISTCNKIYDVREVRPYCECGNLLDVAYPSFGSHLRIVGGPPNLRGIFSRRRDYGNNIYDESGVWRFRELINFMGIDTEDLEAMSRVLVSLDGAEGRTRPYQMSKVANHVGMNPENLWLQPEGLNPSGSFKDNGMATGYTHAKMVGALEVICASTGNTSSSAAQYGANEGIEVRVLTPRGKIAPGKFAQPLQYGAHVRETDGKFDDAMEEVLRQGGYIINSVNPFRIEGQKTIIYRALDWLKWEVPDWLVVPGGNLGNAAAFGKALTELYQWGFIDRLPRLVIVNSDKANTLYALYNGRFQGEPLRWNDGNVNEELIEEFYKHLDKLENEDKLPETEATAIAIWKPRSLKKALRSLHHTDGIVIQVGDQDMKDGMAVVGLNGFDCEMASGAVPAGIKQLVEQDIIHRDDTVVGILTGRLKDPQQIVDYHRNPKNLFANPPM